MKLSLRNLAMGAALAVSSLAFAQEMPFTVTENYAKKYLAGDDTWGTEVASSEVRTAAGVNGKLYAVNKAQRKLFSFDGEGVKLVRSDLPEGLGTSIAADDAGNIIVVTGWAGANSSKHFYLVPADGSDIVDLGATAPFAGLNDNSYAGGRSDNLGRIVGDMLSDDGGIFFVTYEGCTAPGALHIANGAYVEDAFEYSCSPVKTPADAQSIAIPMFNRFADQYEADPNYNAYYLIRRGENFQTPYSGEAVVLSRPAAGEETGVYYNGMPGADVINYEGKTYFVMPCMDENVKQYKPGFLIYDEEGNILFRETFADLEVAAAPYANGGTINVRQIEDYVFEIYVYQHNKADNSVITAEYTVEFPKPAPALPFTMTETFNTTLTKANGGIDAAGIRGGVAFNQAVYMLDKSTGTIYKWDKDGKSEYRTGLNTTALSPAITVDYAGNILVCYGWSGALNGFAIVPADGSDIIYLNELPTVENWAPGRKDVLGRVAGDMLSAEGAYLFLPGTGGTTSAYFYFSEGQIFGPEDGYASSNYITTGNQLDVTVPAASTVADILDLDPLYNGGIYFPWNSGQTACEYIDGSEAIAVKRPEGPQPSGAAGGDVFTFEGKTYYVSTYTHLAGKRTGDFIIFDQEGTALYTSAFPNPDETAAGGFPNGGSIVVRPVDEYTFELGFTGGTTTGFNCATYTIEFPHSVVPEQPKDIYVLGSYNNWAEPTAANADQFVKLTETAAGSNVYTGSVEMAARPSFRFISELAGWEAPQYGAQADEAMVAVALTNNTTYEGSIVAGKGAFNFNGWLGGSMDLTVDLTAMTVKAVATTPIPALAVRGSFDEWGAGVSLTAPEAADAEGKFVYTAEIASLPEGEIKIGQPGSWAINFGGNTDAALENGKAEQAWFDSSNNYKVAAAENVTVTFTLNPDLTQPSELMLTWNTVAPEQTRNNYAYGIVLTDNGAGKYVIDFKATGASTATLILTNEEGEKTFEIGEVKAGDNQYEFDAAQLEYGKEYSFAIALNNDTYATAPALIYTAPQFAQQTRGGMVVINDTESDAFGMAVSCAGKAQGMQLFDQNLETVGTYHAGYAGWTASNQSSPFRGAEREGLAVFCDWSDAGSNYYVFDPLKPEELGTMLGAPATMNKDGLWTLDGVEIGGGNSGLAFVGKGEDTRMYTLIEDNTEHPNTLACYNIGTSPVILEAPAAWFADATRMLPNLNLEIEPAANGMFIAQIRSNVDEASVCRMLYMDFEGNVKASWWNDVIPNCAGGVALTADQQTLAVATQTSILFFEVMMDEETNVPELMPLPEWTIKDFNTDFAELRFDIAGNLYAYSRGQKGVLVYACPMGQDAVTAAKAQYMIKGTQVGVEDIAVDAADADAVYYNLNGVRVAADELTPGIYVKVVGTTATKVVVK